MKRMELCVPCMMRLKEGYEITLVEHRRDKLTCAGCGKRRYGDVYDVKRKYRRRKKTEGD